jgi:hypothetical protein
MRWYLPGNRLRPAHLPPIEHTGAVSVACGPDGGEGRIIGGVYIRDEPGWQQVGGEDGWWINAAGSSPARLLRLDARDGTEIDGAEPNHRWLIPHLFRPAAGGLVWHGEQRLGPGGWAVPAPPEPWQTLGLRIRGPILAGGWEDLGEEAVTDLALLIITSNYHLNACELIAAGWTNRAMIPAALAGVIAIPAEA